MIFFEVHGDETIGREILIGLIYHLLSNYGIDQKITNLIDTTNIFIMPSGIIFTFLNTRRANSCLRYLPN